MVEWKAETWVDPSGAGRAGCWVWTWAKAMVATRVDHSADLSAAKRVAQ